MDADYPEHLLAGAAPPWDGEGAFALWHFSEDPALGPSGHGRGRRARGARAGVGG